VAVRRRLAAAARLGHAVRVSIPPRPPAVRTPAVRTPVPLAASTAFGVLVAVAALVLVDPGAAGALSGQVDAATATAMTPWKAAILGLVEGVTEYLPISSTGHLLVASDLLGLGTTEADVEAANTYAVAIQFGAILAVAGLFWRRFREMLLGLVGRSEAGRHLLWILVVAAVPSAAIGFVVEEPLEEVLYAPWPIVAAWFAGGLLILGLERAGKIPRRGEARAEGHDPVIDITSRQALVIGLAQIAALWPGVSRSLSTMLGALLVGVGMVAAVEFSFLLGFVTLTGASLYKVATDGGTLVDQFGVADPLIGLLFAFLSAVVAIKWMISYLERRSLAVFGWYRLAAAGLTAIFILAGVLEA
jgi:undecaprenyl-diphosphatase